MNNLQRIGPNIKRPDRIDYLCVCGATHMLSDELDKKLQADEYVKDICMTCNPPTRQAGFRNE